MKIIVIFSLVLLCGLAVGQTVFPEVPYLKLVIEGSIEIEGDLEVNKEFTIIFKFMLKPEGYNYRMRLWADSCLHTRAARGDTASILTLKMYETRVDMAYLSADPNVEYLTPAAWIGKLVPNRQNVLVVKARVLHEYQFGIGGTVSTMCDGVTPSSSCATDNFFASRMFFKGKVPEVKLPEGYIVPAKKGQAEIKTIYEVGPSLDSSQTPLKIEETVPVPRRQIDTGNGAKQPDKRISQPESGAGTYYVTGRFYNVYLPHDTVPACQTNGYVAYYYNSSWSYDYPFTTDNNGYFTCISSNLRIRILINSSNYAANVVSTQSHNLGAGEQIINYNFGVEISNPSYQDIQVPPEYCINTRFPGAFHIADKIREGYDAFQSLAYLTQSPIYAFWDTLNNQFEGSFFGGYEVNGIPIIFINNKYFPDDMNWDEWDDPVILHEYAHYLIWCHAERSPYAFGNHNLVYPPDQEIIGNDTNRAPDLVYNEGIADLLQCVLRQTPLSIDSFYNTKHNIYNFERPLPDAPYVFHPDSSSHSYPIWNGARVEGAIAAALWDIYDDVDDDSYYQGGLLYGHNNDHNRSSSWHDFDAIWDVIYNYDPQPDNPDHDHCWNVYEFIDGWRKMGYPANASFENLCEAHYVPVFLPGDANGDNFPNIGDAVYIINYIFKGGPSPHHKEAADCNCDNDINVGDAVYMINYIFKSWPVPPVCPNYSILW